MDSRLISIEIDEAGLHITVCDGRGMTIGSEDEYVGSDDIVAVLDRAAEILTNKFEIY